MPELLDPPALSENIVSAPAPVGSDTEAAAIPAAYRRVENLHIVFWLIKDISWCLFWKPLGLAMILPTLVIALALTWRTRFVKSEFAHNLAIIFWIVANSYWMVSEFAGFDETKIWGNLEGKHLAVVPFVLGILVLANFYVLQPVINKPLSR